MVGEVFPPEHLVECACEVIQTIGYTFDSSKHGKECMDQYVARFLHLKAAKLPNGRWVLSMRVRFWIDELLDMRSNAWQRKEKREQAKTLTDIRKGGVKANTLKAEEAFATTIVGLRPAYIKSCKQTP